MSFETKLSFSHMMTIIVACVLLVGCAGPRTYAEASSIEIVEGAALPAPGRQDVLLQDRPYLIGPFDKLTIDVFGIDELAQRKVQLDASGRISFPLIGSVEAAGLTSEELASTIEARLRGQFIRDPQVTVNLDETTSQRITVDGQVSRPGLYPVLGRMTLLRAVATAGGTTDYAKLDDVVIHRTVEGEKYLALYNLKAVRRGNYSDPEVFANDIIVVGDSPGRRLFRDIVSASGLITSPVVAILR